MSDTPGDARPTIAVIGGTGPQGRGLALRWAAAGLPVVIGSRDAARAAAAAAGIGHGVTGADNLDAATRAEVVVIAVPWEAHADTIRSVAPALVGKILVDCVNPLGFDQQGAYALDVAEGSAAEQAQRLVPDATVVAAFHHVSAVLLGDESVESVDLDVLVLGDDRDATDLVRSLADAIPGVRGIFAGRLRNAGQVEALTANLIAINRRYKAHAGVRVTDV
ncbi:MAG: NADPH-dependent F420 reductase [Nocardioidaceae bacterium]